MAARNRLGIPSVRVNKAAIVAFVYQHKMPSTTSPTKTCVGQCRDWNSHTILKANIATGSLNSHGSKSGPAGTRIDSPAAATMHVSHVCESMTCMSVPGQQSGVSQAETGSVMDIIDEGKTCT